MLLTNFIFFYGISKFLEEVIFFYIIIIIVKKKTHSFGVSLSRFLLSPRHLSFPQLPSPANTRTGRPPPRRGPFGPLQPSAGPSSTRNCSGTSRTSWFRRVSSVSLHRSLPCHHAGSSLRPTSTSWRPSKPFPAPIRTKGSSY